MEYYRKATKIIPDIDIQMAAQYRQSMMTHKNSKWFTCVAVLAGLIFIPTDQKFCWFKIDEHLNPLSFS